MGTHEREKLLERCNQFDVADLLARTIGVEFVILSFIIDFCQSDRLERTLKHHNGGEILIPHARPLYEI